MCVPQTEDLVEFGKASADAAHDVAVAKFDAENDYVQQIENYVVFHREITIRCSVLDNDGVHQQNSN